MQVTESKLEKLNSIYRYCLVESSTVQLSGLRRQEHTNRPTDRRKLYGTQLNMEQGGFPTFAET